MTEEKNVDWKFIRNRILEQKTILFLGPGLTYNHEDRHNLNHSFAKMKEDHPKDILDFNQKDGFLLFSDERKQLPYRDKIKEFYTQDYSNETLEKIAAIPFHLIIQVTPDKTLHKVFKDNRYEFKESYFDTRKKRPIEGTPSGDSPLIYNLFGTVDDVESLIISHYDLFKYLEALYAKNLLPESIATTMDKDYTRSIIFLGFEFDRWYYQLLLHLLNIDDSTSLRFAHQQEQLDSDIKTFYSSFFDISFAGLKAETFVDQLYKEFQPQELRKKQDKEQRPKKYLKDNILKFLNASFNSTELDVFCTIYFEEVKEQFTDEQSKLRRLTLLVDYAARHDRFEDLLEAAKEDYEVQYKKFAPYWEEQ